MPLKGITINTDAATQPHIMAQDDAAIYYCIMGGASGILTMPEGTMAATKINDTTVRIGAGVAGVMGHMARIAQADFHDVTFTAGAVGMNRIDLLCLEFKRVGAVDTMRLMVVQGASTSGTPIQPVPTQQNIATSGTLYQLPLYRVRYVGTTMQTPELMAAVLPSLSTINLKANTADLAAQTIGKGASQLGIYDAAGIFTSTTVEGALYEAKKKADDNATNIGLLSVTDKFAGSPGFTVSNVRAYKVGRKIDLYFSCKPLSGWNADVVYTMDALYNPTIDTPGVAYKSSGADMGLTISAIMTTTGKVVIHASSAFSGTALLHFSYYIY